MKIKQKNPLPPASLPARNALSEAGEAPKTVPAESQDADKVHVLPITRRQGHDKIEERGGLLDGRFELLEILGSGGWSTVYKSIDRNKSEANRDHYITIKVLQRQYRANGNWVAFERASRKYQDLDHPNITKFYSFNQVGTTGYLRMEHLSGESLGQSIRSGHAGRMPVKQALRIVNEIGQALAYAHEQGTVHGDLKPANVFLTDSGEVKVMDFGITQALRGTAEDEAGFPHFGPDNYSASTPSYASPELLDLCEPDPRDDVYALACIAYELLAGRHPFGRVRATGARDFGLEVKPSDAFTKAQWSSLQKALAFDRDERTPTVTEFLAGFDASGSNWVRWVSLVAGFMVFAIAANLFFDRSDTPVRDWLADSGTATAPTLSSNNFPNQPVSTRRPDPQGGATVGLAVETRLQDDEQSVSVQVAPPPVEERHVDGMTTLPLQVTQTRERPPARVAGGQLNDVEPESTIQTAQSSVNASGSVSDELTGTHTADQPKEPESIDDEFAAIMEEMHQERRDVGVVGSERDHSPESPNQSPREEMAQVATELQAHDEGLPERHLTDLLVLAESQIANRRLSSPAGNNALETYREVLRLVPEHEGAEQGIQGIKKHYIKWAEAARDRGDWEKAKAYVRRSAAIDPQDNAALLDRLRELEKASQAEQKALRQAKTDALERAKARTHIARPSPEMEGSASVSSPADAEKEAHLIKLPHGTSRPSVIINEFMASNDQTIADSQGDYDDWIELYNRGREAIDLSGFYLSDNPKKPKKWRFPNGTRIGAYSYLIVWADRSSSYTNMTSLPPEFHANFELSRRGEQILLVDSDKNGNAIIDRISFGRQREDRSMGRSPNGLGEFGTVQAPTPGRVNKSSP